MVDISTIQLILGAIALLGIPFILSNEESEKHGFLHGQGMLFSLVIGNFILMIGAMAILPESGYWFWIYFNILVLVLYVVKTSRK